MTTPLVPDLTRIRDELRTRLPAAAAEAADIIRAYVPVARENGGKARDTLAGEAEDVGDAGRISVTGEGYLDFVIKGTRAHEIFGFGHPLAFTVQDGTVVFAWHVNHPGTTANPFVNDAAAQLDALADRVVTEAVLAVLG